MRYFQKYLNFFFLLTAILQSMLCFYGQVQFSTGWPRNPLSTYMNMLFYFACKFLFAEPTVLLALTNRLVTKIFTAFIGWNGMRLRMKEDRVVEGAFQLALYAFILFLYWLIQIISLIILLTFIRNANPRYRAPTGPSGLALSELDNFVRCKFNDCCWEKKDLDLWSKENNLYLALMAKRAEAELDLSPSPSPLAESSSTRRRLNINTNNTNSNISSFKINFSPQECFKNERGYPAVFGGTQFCGPGHFCNVKNFVNTSNLTNATSTMSIQRRSLREPILSLSDGDMNRDTGGWMPRRRLLSSTTTSSQTITTTTGAPANNSSNNEYAPSPSIFAAPAPAPSSAELKPLFIRSKPVYPGDPICHDIFKGIVTDAICSDFDLWYQKFMEEFENNLMWIIYVVLGIAFFELVGIINAMAANCWFCGPPVKVDIDEEYTDSESSSDEEDENGVIHHHHGHHRGDRKPKSMPLQKIQKRKPKFHRVGVI